MKLSGRVGSCELFQLLDKGFSRFDYWSFESDLCQCLLERPSAKAHEIVGDDGGTPRHTSDAVDQHVSAVSLFMYELVAVRQHLPNVLPVVILNFMNTADDRLVVAVPFQFVLYHYRQNRANLHFLE